MGLPRFHKNTLIVLAADLLLAAGALYLAHLIRWDFDIPPRFMRNFLWLLPLALAIKLGCFYLFDLYSGMWRYTSVRDLFNIIKATAVSSGIIFLLILFAHRFIGFSRSVFIIDWCLTLLAVSAFRLAIRVYFESCANGASLREILSLIFSPGLLRRADRKNLLIIGAGDGAEKIYREIHDNPILHYNVVGFLDDNPSKVGRKIHGIPVLGKIGEIRHLARSTLAEEALIAIPSANSRQMRIIVEHCKQAQIPFKTMPSYGELISGAAPLGKIREVAYSDLIGRDQVRLDEERIRGFLHGSTVLVTGAGGSIGSELCRQLGRFDPERIILLERAESQLYQVELELKARFAGLDVQAVLGDILDEVLLERVFKRFSPRLIFHAAAYKHVPLLEFQPWRAVMNNVLGTARLIEHAGRNGVDSFVLVSSDKAVRPANVMGATKRIAEMLTLNQNLCRPAGTKFMAVRFGNVLGSAGSVVPLFRQQILDGGPVTVTHPEVRRFFMTISEACQLILQSAAMGQGGEIFILDMGEPIRIEEMARDLIRLSGLEPDVDIQITYTGLRPGEKLCEELISGEENIVRTAHDKIMRVTAERCDIELLNGQVEALVRCAERLDGEAVVNLLRKMVPDFERPVAPPV